MRSVMGRSGVKILHVGNLLIVPRDWGAERQKHFYETDHQQYPNHRLNVPQQSAHHEARSSSFDKGAGEVQSHSCIAQDLPYRQC